MTQRAVSPNKWKHLHRNDPNATESKWVWMKEQMRIISTADTMEKIGLIVVLSPPILRMIFKKARKRQMLLKAGLLIPKTGI